MKKIVERRDPRFQFSALAAAQIDNQIDKRAVRLVEFPSIAREFRGAPPRQRRSSGRRADAAP
ncbi:MAG: hypothetical protein KF773_21160 [Deltaproteobacteria bacterium]|nr:hypothetical protein [Deltaproteobacteria bacterium]MCW5801697.1 hypothetical protein [Deltaproteobacteria bacterium]